MNTYTDQQLDEIFSSIPQELQDYILDEDTGQALNEVIERNDIPNEEVFKQQVLLLLMGHSSIETLSAFLKNECGMSEEEVETALNDLDANIFSVVDAMMDEDKNQETTPPQKPAPSILLAQREEVMLPPAAAGNLSNKPLVAPDIAAAVKNLKPIQPLNTPFTTSNGSITLNTQAAPKPIEQIKTEPMTHASILDTKLTATTNLPKEELNLNASGLKSQKPNETPSPKTPPPQNYSGSDPYREPLE